MFVRRSNEFIIPIKYLDISEFDISEEAFDSRESEKDAKDIEFKLEKKVRYLFFKLSDLVKISENEDIYYICERVLESISLVHVNNIPCFKGIKEKEVSGIDEKNFIKYCLGSFKKIYDYHVNKFKCDINTEKNNKTLTKKKLEVKLKNIDNEIEELFEELYEKVGFKSNKYILDIHIFMFTSILNLLIEDLPCFIEVKKQLKETELKAIIKMHVINFTEAFNECSKQFKCW